MNKLTPALTQALLQEVALNPDFQDILLEAFGTEIAQPLALTLQQQWQNGDFSLSPTVVILPSETIPMARGAYARSRQTIYFNEQWLQSASESEIKAVYLEELGHHLDFLLKEEDTPGDEGQLFSALIRGESLTPETTALIKAEDDTATIIVDEEEVSIEQSNKIYIPFRQGTRVRITRGYTEHYYAVDFDDISGQNLDIVAVASGTVVKVEAWNNKRGVAGGYGNYIVVRNDSGSYDYYAHLKDKPTLNVGASVSVGTFLGIMGNTGWVEPIPADGNLVTGRHLHFERKQRIGDGGQIPVSFFEDKTGDGYLTSADGEIVSQNPGENSPPPPPPQPIDITKVDLVNSVYNVTGDGRGEILFRSPNGDVGSFITSSSGDGISNWYYRLGTADPNITMLGAGDMNGDGRDEVLFRVSYGEIFAFRLNDQGVATDFYRVGIADARIPVVGIGDITGDGRDEIIFRVTEGGLGQDVGNVAAFFMDGNGEAYRYGYVGSAESIHPVVGTGDITGDGRDEIIFRESDGDVKAFTMNSEGLATQYIRVGEVDPRIPIVGIGDITGDNRDEIIFHIKQDGLGQTVGNVTAFKMNSEGLAISYYEVGNANAQMPIVGVGDITGDNRDEILFQQSNGYISAFQMDTGGVAYRYYQVNAVNPKVTGVNYSTPSISISDATLYEGNSGNQNANFTVSLNHFSGDTITVNYGTANDSAGAGSDYQGVSGTLTFNPGETTKTISVPVYGDVYNEDNERFSLNLSSPSNASLSRGQGFGDIYNDDPTPNLTINDLTVTEGNSGTQNMTFTVSLSERSNKTITVNYGTANDSATAGSDYQGVSGTLTFAPHETGKTINVS